MKTLAKLLWVEAKLFAREPIAMVFAFAFPLVVLLVLAGVFGSKPNADFGGAAGIDYYVPGYLAVVIASVGLIGLPVHLASLRERGVLRRLRASSVSMTSVLAAQTAVHLAMAALGGAVLLAAASLVYDVHAPASVAGVALGFGVGALSFVALGLLLGSLAPTARAAQAVGLVLFFPMWLLSGAGPPRGVMTEAMRQLSDVLPLTRVVTAIQQPWLGTGSNLPELVALSGLFAVAVVLTAWTSSVGAAGLRPSSRRHQRPTAGARP
jgi:ABC-2 type transport system permease protein